MRAGQAAPQSKNSVRLPEKTGRTNCGESGIRTHDTLLGYTHFPGAHLQPLGHFSLLAGERHSIQPLKYQTRLTPTPACQ